MRYYVTFMGLIQYDVDDYLGNKLLVNFSHIKVLVFVNKVLETERQRDRGNPWLKDNVDIIFTEHTIIVHYII